MFIFVFVDEKRVTLVLIIDADRITLVLCLIALLLPVSIKAVHWLYFPWPGINQKNGKFTFWHLFLLNICP